MAKIAGSKVAKAASDAGFAGDLLITMVAIARAESAWDPKAHNDRPPDDSYGLWQITDRHVGPRSTQEAEPARQ